MGADDPSQPEPRRHGHRHRHPDPAANHLHPELVGLDVPEVGPTLQDQVLVDLLAVLTRPGLPSRHRALVEAEGGNYRLDRTAVAEQREHDSRDVQPCTQAVEGRALGCREGLATGPALIAPFLLAEHPDVALPDPSSVRAVWVVAELSLRVHRRAPDGVMW